MAHAAVSDVPPPLVPEKFSVDDAWGATLEDRQWCAARLKGARSEDSITPPSLEGTVVFPNVGGVNWGGISHDPERAC